MNFAVFKCLRCRTPGACFLRTVICPVAGLSNDARTEEFPHNRIGVRDLPVTGDDRYAISDSLEDGFEFVPFFLDGSFQALRL